jgi:CRP/FNR family cyclic AMP-dependent transcriptional regulator
MYPVRSASFRGNPGVWPTGSLLGGLTRETQARLLGLGVKEQYNEPTRVLVKEHDEESKIVYLLLSGMVKVTANSGDAQSLLAIRLGGDLIGEISALDNSPRLATVTTVGPVLARVIKQADFVGFLARNPDVSLAITRSITDKLRNATKSRIDFASYPPAVRLARVLLELARRYGADSPQGRMICCQLSQAELATLAGTKEPTAQRALRELREAGIIASGYRVMIIVDLPRLSERANPFPGKRLAGQSPSGDVVGSPSGLHDEGRGGCNDGASTGNPPTVHSGRCGRLLDSHVHARRARYPEPGPVGDGPGLPGRRGEPGPVRPAGLGRRPDPHLSAWD